MKQHQRPKPARRGRAQQDPSRTSRTSRKGQSSRPPPTGHLYVCSPAFDTAAAAVLDVIATPGPGLLLARGTVQEPIFSRQVLPSATEHAAASLDGLALSIFQGLSPTALETLLLGQARVHVSWPEPIGQGRDRRHPPWRSEAQALAQALEDRRVGRAEKQGLKQAVTQTHLLQVLVTGRWQAYASFCAADLSDPLSAWPSAFAGGRAEVDDAPAPSSAFRKLVEAMAWLGTSPTAADLVLDLGAAPGGWTYIAAGHGARVLAYDRADLDPALNRHPRVEHRREDAFRDPPTDEATWMLCDIIDQPDRAAWLVARAAASKTIRALVVTLKLTRPIDHALLARIDAALPRDIFTLRLKHLVHNKCEVTILGRRREPEK